MLVSARRRTHLDAIPAQQRGGLQRNGLHLMPLAVPQQQDIAHVEAAPHSIESWIITCHFQSGILRLLCKLARRCMSNTHTLMCVYVCVYAVRVRTSHN